MSDPTPQTRDKVPSRFRSFFARKWQGKDIAVAVLALLFLSMSAYAFRAPSRGGWHFPSPAQPEPADELSAQAGDTLTTPLLPGLRLPLAEIFA